jgi:hypothetical protein
MRAAGPDDYPALRALGSAWFPAETLIDSALYRRLLESAVVCVRMLDTEQGPAGYYALWPLTAAAYESLRRGEKRERDLGAEEIVAPEDGRASMVYVADICVAQGESGPVLLRDMRRTVVDLLRAHPHITGVAAWAFSAEGARLAARLGMRPVPQNPALVQIAATSIMSKLAARP